MSFTDLKGTLSVRVGTLYYHFETLAPLIAQDEQKRYVLTQLGSKAYQLMSVEETEARPDFRSKPSVGLAHHARNLLSPPSYFAFLYSRPKLGIVAALVLIVVGTYLLYGAKLEPIMFFLDRAATTQQSLIPFELLASWVTVYVLSELLATGLFRRRGDHHLLFMGTAFAFGPLFVLPALILLESSLSIGLSITENTLLERGMLVVFQSWSIVVLTSAIAVSKGLGIEKAAVIALAIAYVNILLLYVLGRIG